MWVQNGPDHSPLNNLNSGSGKNAKKSRGFMVLEVFFHGQIINLVISPPSLNRVKLEQFVGLFRIFFLEKCWNILLDHVAMFIVLFVDVNLEVGPGWDLMM